MSHYLHCEIDASIARIALNAPNEKVNVLNSEFLEELDLLAEELAQTLGVKAAVVFSEKQSGFIAGADIDAIAHITDPSKGAELAQKGQTVFNRWEKLPFPVIGAIHGHCMGGGTEFALACHFRVAAPSAQIALPEVKLGILPGFGGTQRLPRLITFSNALDMILSGRTIRAEKAKAWGLVDQLAKEETLLEEALSFAQQVISNREGLIQERTSRMKGLKNYILDRTLLGQTLQLNIARKQIHKKTGDHYPAPFKALEIIGQGLRKPMGEGLRSEAKALGELIVTPECKNLIHVFYLSQRAKKQAQTFTAPAPMQAASVLGAGVMGAEIAWQFAQKKIPVTIKDIRPEAIDSGLSHIRTLFEKKNPSETQEKMNRVRGTVRYEDLAHSDIVVEAVLEKMDIKKTVLKETEEAVSSSTIFATNTSALSVTELQSAARRPENVGGMHFFNPVHRMPLVEIIQGEKTSDKTVSALYSLAMTLGKTPIIVQDRPGFLVNRLLVAYLNEACLLAEEGVRWSSLDRWAVSFGLPMGPFRLIDEVGIDIAAEVGDTLAGAFPYLKESHLLSTASVNGLLGKKVGKGFYRYPSGKNPEPNRQVDEALNLKPDRDATPSDGRRLLLLMVNEAGRCLDEGVIQDAADIDTGMIFGTGFPPFRGGLCRWADAQGVDQIRQELLELEKLHGQRFAPCDFFNSHTSMYTEA